MNLRKISFILLLLFYIPVAFSYAQTDNQLQELSRTIENREIYVEEKQENIEKLKNQLDQDELSLQKQFDITNKLLFEYEKFQYDSAFSYAIELQQTARQLNDSDKVTYAKLKVIFTMLSSGIYNESLDSLNSLNPKLMLDSLKVNFYELKSRAYYDLSSYLQDTYYTPRYLELAEVYLDSALALVDENSLQFYAIRGRKHEIAGEPLKAKVDFEAILNEFDLTLNRYAMTTYSLGNIYYKQGDINKGIEMMARAAIADIKASVKEGVALMTLAKFLYQNGDEARAYDYIKQALDDTEFYGARQLKIQVAAILPVIEGERLATVEEQRSELATFSIAMTVLAVLVVIFAFIIFKQLRQLREAKRTVTEAYDQLQQTNEKLLEADRIKEEYIGYSFNMYSDYLNKIEKLKKSIDRKLMARKFDEISYVLESVNLKKEREALYQSFDQIFLKLFPNFVPAFNSFFKDEDKVVLKDNQSLNIELRIFALIRMGINDYEQIAKILEYSVRTIYNYKSKVKNRSFLSNEEFEQKVLEIKAF